MCACSLAGSVHGVVLPLRRAEDDLIRNVNGFHDLRAVPIVAEQVPNQLDPRYVDSVAVVGDGYTDSAADPFVAKLNLERTVLRGAPTEELGQELTVVDALDYILNVFFCHLSLSFLVVLLRSTLYVYYRRLNFALVPSHF